MDRLWVSTAFRMFCSLFSPKPGRSRSFALARQFFDVGHRCGLEVGPEKRDFLRPERLQVQNVEQGDRELLQQLLAQAVVAGLR